MGTTEVTVTKGFSFLSFGNKPVCVHGWGVACKTGDGQISFQAIWWVLWVIDLIDLIGMSLGLCDLRTSMSPAWIGKRPLKRGEMSWKNSWTVDETWSGDVRIVAARVTCHSSLRSCRWLGQARKESRWVAAISCPSLTATCDKWGFQMWC